MANTSTKKEESSIAIAPQPITPPCFNIAGMAMLPMPEAPVKNLIALSQLHNPPSKEQGKNQCQSFPASASSELTGELLLSLKIMVFTCYWIQTVKNNHPNQQSRAKEGEEEHTLSLQQQQTNAS